MTYKAEVRVDVDNPLGDISPRIYGQLIEHLGRLVYGGIMDPGSALSDEAGFRLDVQEAAAGLGPSLLRWPGGNSASGYNWRDGIGDKDSRPKSWDPAWSAIDDNSFGTEEFLEYCRRLGAEPYVNINMGTGTFEEALAWVEYCNATEPGVPAVDLRRSGPHPDPHGVPIWGLGNEVYGWWQAGSQSVESYAHNAREWGKLMRWRDPSISLVAVGNAPDEEWNRTVLEQVRQVADYLSLHFYWRGEGTDDERYDSIVAGPAASEQQLVSVWDMCQEVLNAQPHSRPITLAIDEWGVWSRTYQGLHLPEVTAKIMAYGFSAEAGLDTGFEEVFDLKDALAIASWLNVMWRHPDKIGLAGQAQMINVIAPILTSADAVVRQTIWYPMAIAREVAGGVALDVECIGDERVTAKTSEGSAPALDASATFDPDQRRVHISLVNRSRDQECWLDLRLAGATGPLRVIELWHDDPFAENTFESPERVTLVERTIESTDEPLVLKPHSHVTLVTALEPS